MEELWYVYDRFKRKTGKIIKRDSEERLQDGEYHLVVTGILNNSENKILISRRSPRKKLYPNLWECTSGSVKLGETSIEAIKREIYEEIGIDLVRDKGRYLGTIQQNDYFREIWLFSKNIEDGEIFFNDKEVVEVKWVTKEKYREMYKKNEIVPTGEAILNLLDREREDER